jgi:hypothetical protein
MLLLLLFLLAAFCSQRMLAAVAASRVCSVCLFPYACLLLLLLPGQQEDHQGGEAPACVPRQEVRSEGLSLTP